MKKLLKQLCIGIISFPLLLIGFLFVFLGGFFFLGGGFEWEWHPFIPFVALGSWGLAALFSVMFLGCNCGAAWAWVLMLCIYELPMIAVCGVAIQNIGMESSWHFWAAIAVMLIASIALLCVVLHALSGRLNLAQNQQSEEHHEY